MPLVTEDDVRDVAHLARLALGADEVKRLTKQLEAILGYMQVLQRVSTTDVEPMWHVLPLQNVTRADRPRPSLPVEAVLDGVPARQGALVRVPPVIETA